MVAFVGRAETHPMCSTAESHRLFPQLALAQLAEEAVGNVSAIECGSLAAMFLRHGVRIIGSNMIEVHRAAAGKLGDGQARKPLFDEPFYSRSCRL
ncbi:nucleoside diphosphate kinase [Anopheles sinensis]|uniref:Nucleoside diphosphate kinase n=1 Tax=Anopheles sinensis TaxID=74873 RepID=A0A084WCI4_ANOSI|nr:nucleoside diphosphate kinase [Anopheles sinensis]